MSKLSENQELIVNILLSKMAGLTMKLEDLNESHSKITRFYTKEILLKSELEQKVAEEERERDEKIAGAYEEGIVVGSNERARQLWISKNIPSRYDTKEDLESVSAGAKESEALLSNFRFLQRSILGEVDMLKQIMSVNIDHDLTDESESLRDILDAMGEEREEEEETAVTGDMMREALSQAFEDGLLSSILSEIGETPLSQAFEDGFFDDGHRVFGASLNEDGSLSVSPLDPETVELEREDPPEDVPFADIPSSFVSAFDDSEEEEEEESD